MFAGCNKSDPLDPQPTSGKVIVNGKPAAGCIVAFVPIWAAEYVGQFLPGGVTDENGSFEITTTTSGDGVPMRE